MIGRVSPKLSRFLSTTSSIKKKSGCSPKSIVLSVLLKLNFRFQFHFVNIRFISACPGLLISVLVLECPGLLLSSCKSL
jgi:hypothetical protein